MTFLRFAAALAIGVSAMSSVTFANENPLGKSIAHCEDGTEDSFASVDIYYRNLNGRDQYFAEIVENHVWGNNFTNVWAVSAEVRNGQSRYVDKAQPTNPQVKVLFEKGGSSVRLFFVKEAGVYVDDMRLRNCSTPWSPANTDPSLASSSELINLGDLSADDLEREFEQMPDEQAIDADPDAIRTRIPRYKTGVELFPAAWPKEKIEKILIHVNKATQRLFLKLTVTGADGNESEKVVASWPVSTGMAGFRTPNYSERGVLKLVFDYWSRKYDAPMNWAVFITPGIAVHATPASNYHLLGRPASHGCIRLTETKAYWLYNYVSTFRKSTRILVN